MLELENMQNDNINMHEAVKKIKCLKPLEKLIIKGKDSQTVNPTEESKMLQNILERLSTKICNLQEPYQQHKWQYPSLQDEIQKLIAKMKLSKTPEYNLILVEHIKCAPKTKHWWITEIYNTMEETGDTPRQVTHGVLKPLQKPSKVKGSSLNLRLIIFLSCLHKIFVACNINRIKDRLHAEIPPLQAASRPNWSKIEHTFTSKLIIERTITTKNKLVH